MRRTVSRDKTRLTTTAGGALRKTRRCARNVVQLPAGQRHRLSAPPSPTRSLLPRLRAARAARSPPHHEPMQVTSPCEIRGRCSGDHTKSTPTDPSLAVVRAGNPKAGAIMPTILLCQTIENRTGRRGRLRSDTGRRTYPPPPSPASRPCLHRISDAVIRRGGKLGRCLSPHGLPRLSFG